MMTLKELWALMDYNRIKVTCKDGSVFEGVPVDVEDKHTNDEITDGNEILDLYNDNGYWGVRNTEIISIEIIE